MQRKRELKILCPTKHIWQHFPLILDAWLQAKRRRDHVDKFSDEKFSSFFFRSRTNKTHTTTPHSREEEFLTNRTEEKNGFYNAVFAVLIYTKKSARRRRQRRRSEIDRSRIAVMSSSVCVAKQAPIVVGSFGTKRRSPNNNSTARSIQRQTLVKTFPEEREQNRRRRRHPEEEKRNLRRRPLSR